MIVFALRRKSSNSNSLGLVTKLLEMLREKIETMIGKILNAYFTHSEENTAVVQGTAQIENVRLSSSFHTRLNIGLGLTDYGVLNQLVLSSLS